MFVGAVGNILVEVADELPVIVEFPDTVEFPAIVELPETVALPDVLLPPAEAEGLGAGVIVNTKVSVTVLSTLFGPGDLVNIWWTCVGSN
jgi:hypothetical protein